MDKYNNKNYIYYALILHSSIPSDTCYFAIEVSYNIEDDIIEPEKDGEKMSGCGISYIGYIPIRSETDAMKLKCLLTEINNRI